MMMMTKVMMRMMMMMIMTMMMTMITTLGMVCSRPTQNGTQSGKSGDLQNFGGRNKLRQMQTQTLPDSDSEEKTKEIYFSLFRLM